MCLLGASVAPSQETLARSEIRLERADRVEYLEREQRLILTGNVRVQFETNTIQADTIHVDLVKNILTAEGNLIWDGEGHHATGSRMTFNTKTEEGVVEDVTLTTGLWICRGQRIVQPEANVAVVQPGLMTTCDLQHPHYSIKCKRIRIRLNRDLTARRVTFLVGSTPVLWLPILKMPVKEFRFPFGAQFGQTQELGTFIRTSPAYHIGSRSPGQAHLDFFQQKGWGYGLTQELTDAKGKRILRGHGYYIKERTTTTIRPTPQQRWELFVEGVHRFSPSTRLSTRVALVSDAHFRELYGDENLKLPTTAGQRTARVLLSQKLPGANASVMMERTYTQRLIFIGPLTLIRESRYALSTIHAPRLTVTSRPKPVASWLNANVRGDMSRTFRWRNEWYVNSTSLTPGLEAFWRLPVLGRATVTPRLQSVWRDRGDRVLLDDGTIGEDTNRRGGVYRAITSTSLRPTIPLGLRLELSHSFAKRLNKTIGRDPLDRLFYHGLERHSARGRLSWSLGRIGSAAVSQSYDLRNKQDPVRRRWSPLEPQVTFTPHRLLTIGVQAKYDLWDQEWRKQLRGISSSIALGGEPGGSSVRLRPRYTNNRLGLPQATTTAQNYRLAQRLYGLGFQDATRFPYIFLVDGEVSVPLTRRTRVEATGQYDARQGQFLFYTLSVSRNLHCWELVGTFQQFASGELRFHASMGLAAFPKEAIPLLRL